MPPPRWGSSSAEPEFKAGNRSATMPRMRHVLASASIAILLASAGIAQTLDKELVASISGAALDRGIVSELLWDGGTLIIQSAVVEPDGQLKPRYFAAPAANMELQQPRGRTRVRRTLLEDEIQPRQPDAPGHDRRAP